MKLFNPSARFLELFAAELARRGVPHVGRLTGWKLPFWSRLPWVAWRTPTGGWCALVCYPYSLRPHVLRARVVSQRVRNPERFRELLELLEAEDRFEPAGGEHNFLPQEAKRIARWLAGRLLSGKLERYTWTRTAWAEYWAHPSRVPPEPPTSRVPPGASRVPPGAAQERALYPQKPGVRTIEIVRNIETGEGGKGGNLGGNHV